MWAERYKGALAKSSHGGQSLYDHSMQAVEAAARALGLVGEPCKRAADVALLAAAIHDVGKLDPDFQRMLKAARDLPGDRTRLPGKRVKHEASTLDYDHPHLVRQSLEEICNEIRASCGYSIDLHHVGNDGMEWLWAFAVTHHGLLYLSYEQGREGTVRPLVRRKWTAFYPNEVSRITLADLLFTFHPVGGLVILGDLMASYAFEQQRELKACFDGVSSLRSAFERLMGVADEIETSLQSYDPRTYALHQTLELIAGGL